MSNNNTLRAPQANLKIFSIRLQRYHIYAPCISIMPYISSDEVRNKNSVADQICTDFSTLSSMVIFRIEKNKTGIILKRHVKKRASGEKNDDKKNEKWPNLAA